MLPLVAHAQTITKEQLELFQSLPRAQQEALARQYGVDLSSLEAVASGTTRERPTQPQVVVPISQPRDDAQQDVANNSQDDREASKNQGDLKPYG